MLFKLFTDNDPIPRLFLEAKDSSEIDRRLIAHTIMAGGAKDYWRLNITKTINRGKHEESTYNRRIMVEKLRNTVNQDDYISEHIGYMIQSLD